MFRLLILIGLLLCASLSPESKGQNLIANSAFEKLTLFARDGGKISGAKGWKAHSKRGTVLQIAPPPFYIVNKASGSFPNEAPLSGFTCARVSASSWLSVSLTEPLQAGQSYLIQAHFNPYPAEKMPIEPVFALGAASPQSLELESQLDVSNYLRYTAVYRAKGGETEFWIGFKGNESQGNTALIASLDDVWLEPTAGGYLYGTKEGTPTTAKGYTQWLPNPGLEKKSACPLAREEFNYVHDWKPGKNTPDYFHLCAANEGIGPLNELGYQLSHSGLAYGGIWVSCAKAKKKEEYILVKFPQNLKGRTRYTLTFYLSLADISNYALKNIQIKIFRSLNRAPREFDIALPDRAYLDQKGRWMKMELIFEAKGDELSLMIGNFRLPNKTPKKKVSRGGDRFIQPLFRKSAYYYIDDITLTAPGNLPAPPPPPKVDPANPPAPPLEESEETLNQLLKDVHFAFDSDSLQAESYIALDLAVLVLKDLPETTIQVNGHTDNEGDAAYNLKLSKRRAKAVAEYLASKGIPARQLKYKGHGETQPIASNRSEDGRRENRRVVIRLYK